MIKRVYVAGALTPKGLNSIHPAIDYLLNVRNLVRWSLKVLFSGFIPFCPAIDFTFFLLLREDENITEDMIKNFGLDWLEVCDAILLTPNWEKSSGTIIEKEYAESKGIPVFYSIQELIQVKGK